jgi:hypothetical protein
MGFQPSEVVTLPIGIEDQSGRRFREVIIDEMTGVDEENIASKKIRNNGAKAVTVLLQRCIQAIPGLVEKKKRSTDLIDIRIIQSLFTADRDFLFFCIRALSMDDTFTTKIACPKCGEVEEHSYNVADLDVLDLPEEDSPTLEVELPRGFEDEEGNMHTKVTWAYPTGKQQEALAGMTAAKMGTAMLSMCIQSVEGLAVRPDSEMVRRLRTRDRMALMAAVHDNTPGVDLRQDYDCAECDHAWEGAIDIQSFFNLAGGETPTHSNGGTNGRRLKKRH